MKREKSGFANGMHWITAICAVGAVTFAVLYFSFGGEPWLSLLFSFGTTFYHFAMRLLVGLIVARAMKNSKFNHENFWFKQKKFEKKLYRFLGVKNWKENVPTYAPEQFSVKDHSLEEIIQATCVAEVVHEVIVLFSFLPLAFTFLTEEKLVGFFIFLGTSIIAAAFDMIFVIVQRFNRPRIVRLKALAERKKEKRDG